MDVIKIDIGVFTHFVLDCSQVDFTGITKLIFTIKNSPNVKAPAIIEKEITEPKEYTVHITPEESIKLKQSAVWDIDKVLIDGKRYKMTGNGRVILRKGVGDCIE